MGRRGRLILMDFWLEMLKVREHRRNPKSPEVKSVDVVVACISLRISEFLGLSRWV